MGVYWNYGVPSTISGGSSGLFLLPRAWRLVLPRSVSPYSAILRGPPTSQDVVITPTGSRNHGVDSWCGSTFPTTA